MIHKRLISTVSHTRKYIAANVAVQWVSLWANIMLIQIVTWFLGELFYGKAEKRTFLIVAVHALGAVLVRMVCFVISSRIMLIQIVTWFLGELFYGKAEKRTFLIVAVHALGAVLVRMVCFVISSRMSFLSSKSVKQILREKIYGKLLNLGVSYKENVRSSEVVQVAVEGVDQLETYFGSYLPQFFYAVLAPVTLFLVLLPISWISEVVQVAVEGVDQLETYFGSYLPQFFYAVLAPVTLFLVLLPISWISAVVLLCCVPLIPI